MFWHFHYTTHGIEVSFFYAKSRTCSFIEENIEKEVLSVLENYPYLLDFKQVQEILRIGRNQLLFRLQSGELPAFKVGRKWRIRKNELLRYMEEGEQAVLDE